MVVDIHIGDFSNYIMRAVFVLHLKLLVTLLNNRLLIVS